MGMKARSLIDNINLTFIALTATAIHQCLSAWKTGECRNPPEFGPGGGAQHKCDTRNINDAGNDACTDEFRCLDVGFRSSTPEVHANKIDNISSLIRRKIHSTGTDPAMEQPYNHEGSFEEDFLDYVLKELIVQHDNPFNCLNSIVAATEASMRFSAVLPIGGSAIGSSSQPIPCNDSNRNSNDITNMPCVHNTGSLNGSTIVEGAMLLGG
jgi:hypothetical protein